MSLTPDSPADAALKLRSMAIWNKLEDACAQAQRMARFRRPNALHHWLEVAACLYQGIPYDAAPPADDISRIPTRDLLAELTRRGVTHPQYSLRKKPRGSL